MKKVLAIAVLTLFTSGLIVSCEKESVEDYENTLSIRKDKVESPGSR